MNEYCLDIVMRGFMMGIALIVPIGVQNAYILRMGVMRHYLVLVPLIAALSDSLMFYLGVNGVGSVVAESPVILEIARWGGAGFLVWMGVGSWRRAWRMGRVDMDLSAMEKPALKVVLGTMLAVTFLNPHVYLDSWVLIGSLAAQYGDARMQFGYGAMLGSFVWFFSLCWGGRLLAPLFKRRRTWVMMEVVVGGIMMWIAYGLVVKGVSCPV